MAKEYIDLDVNEVPVQFEIDFEQDTYTMGINYNESYDFYTVDLWDAEGYVIVLGGKMVLGRPLFESIVDERLPAPSIVPLDESNVATSISKANFYKTVFLTLDNATDDPFDQDIGDGDNLGDMNG